MVQFLAALLTGLALGIGLSASEAATWIGNGGSESLWALGLGLLALVVLALGSVNLGGVASGQRPLRPFFRWLALTMGVMPLACAWSLWRSPVMGSQDPGHWAPLRHGVVSGIVASDPRRTENGLRFELNVEGLLRPVPTRGSGTILVRADPGSVRSTPPAHGELRYGQRVRIHGSLKLPSGAQNPGEFDYRAYLARNAIFAVMNARQVQVLPEEPAPSLIGGAIALKNDALALLSRHLPPAQAALLGSLLFGDGASPLDPETAETFRALGLAHVLAVSGAQILFLWGMLKGLLEAYRLPLWAGVVIGCASLWGYATMTGLPPSVVRATWMGCALIIGWAVSRPWLRYLTLEVVVIGMLLYRPSLLFDVGFQFSAIATFALLHTSPKLLPLFRRLPEVVAQALAMALAAGLWVLPLQVFHFGQLSPYSLPLNAITCFMVEAVTVLGFVAVLGGSLSELLGHHLLSGCYLLLEAFTGIVSATLPLPAASQYLRIPPPWWLGLAYLCLAGGIALIGRGNLRRAAWLGFFPILAFVTWDRTDRPRDLEIVALAIGQGDALIVRTPAQRWYLIDGGPCWEGGDAGSRTILPYLRRRGCKQLDGIILTHGHDDHAGGLASVTEGLPVAAAWDSGQAGSSPAMQHWLERVLERRIPLIPVKEGMRAELESGLSLDVLGPPDSAHRGSRSDANNNSVVLRLRYGSFSMLFAGDLETEAENHLLEHPERLRATVLKVAHHGSRYGSGREFLSAVRPQASVISVGAQNSFRPPAVETLARLRPYGRIYRTDQHGAVTIRSDGSRWSVTPRVEN
ncbi:ComEC family competence protein [compost metagenome]